jgi:hypothetical protein
MPKADHREQRSRLRRSNSEIAWRAKQGRGVGDTLFEFNLGQCPPLCSYSICKNDRKRGGGGVVMS